MLPAHMVLTDCGEYALDLKEGSVAFGWVFRRRKTRWVATRRALPHEMQTAMARQEASRLIERSKKP